MSENVTWMKWYPQDWLADPGLRMCSPAARGVWMDLIAVMHDATPYGHLLVGDAAPSQAALARLTGLTVPALAKLLRELEANNVLARTEAGVIFSRRMVRDEAARIEGRFHATKGKATPPPPPPEGEAPPTAPTGEGAEGGGSPPTPTGEPPLSRARERPETRDQKKNHLTSFGGGALADRRGHRLPDDWLPDPEGVRLCAELGLDLSRTLAQFRDHWRAKPGKDACKLDWDATWRTWCRRERPPRQADTAHARRAQHTRDAMRADGVTDRDVGFLPA